MLRNMAEGTEVTQQWGTFEATEAAECAQGSAYKQQNTYTMN